MHACIQEAIVLQYVRVLLAPAFMTRSAAGCLLLSYNNWQLGLTFFAPTIYSYGNFPPLQAAEMNLFKLLLRIVVELILRAIPYMYELCSHLTESFKREISKKNATVKRYVTETCFCTSRLARWRNVYYIRIEIWFMSFLDRFEDIFKKVCTTATRQRQTLFHAVN